MQENNNKPAVVLPTLNELSMQPEDAFKNDAFKMLVNHPPKAEWVKTNKFANNSSYMPIDKVEILLDTIFQMWEVHVLNITTMFNSVCVTVRLRYKHPVTGEWMSHDGVGAKGVQVDSGCKASDMAAIKENAVTMALPIAKSYAIKDAADHLGKIFGRDLNRKDVVDFSPAYAKSLKVEKKKEVVKNAPKTDLP